MVEGQRSKVEGLLNSGIVSEPLIKLIELIHYDYSGRKL